MSAYYKVGTLYTGRSVLHDCFVGVSGGIFSYIGREKPADSSAMVDYSGYTMTPGFIDVHTHGYAGCDVLNFGKGESEICRFNRLKLKQGVTCYLPTCTTANILTYEAVLRAVTSHLKNTEATPVAGINMEGPYLNPNKAGAQNKGELKDFSDLSALYLIKCYKDLVKMITIAPELEKAEVEIADLSKDFIVSLGHSEADGDMASAAYRSGASCATHLFNAMSGLSHRELGLAGVALSNDGIYTELICDGYHVLPEVVKMVFQLKPRNKILLITDSVDAAGGPVGESVFAGLPVIYDGERVTLKYGGNLAGSALTLDKALRNAMRFTGKPLEEVLPAVTLNPAELLGIAEQKGSVELKKDADFVLLDERCEVKEVYLKGNRQLVFE